MRVLVVPAVVLVALSMACPSGRTVGGEGEGEEGEGEAQPVTGASCDVDGHALAVDGDGDVDSDGSVDSAVTLTGDAPNLACVGNPLVVDASVPVTMEGCVDIFGVGSTASRGITVSVYEEGVDPSTGTPLTTGVVKIRDDAGGLDCGAADANNPACLAFNCDSEGYYRLEGTVPSNTPLTMKILAVGNNNVIPTYLWGIVVPGDQVVDGTFVYEAALIFRSTWQSIPSLSGRQITGGQTVGDGEGRAVIAGELHDCDDVILQNATIGLSDFDRNTMTITYFDGEEDPKPDLARTASANDGLYAILNVTTDPTNNEHVIFGGARTSCDGDNCTCDSLSSRTIKTFPDSVSIATLRGDFPVIE